MFLKLFLKYKLFEHFVYTVMLCVLLPMHVMAVQCMTGRFLLHSNTKTAIIIDSTLVVTCRLIVSDTFILISLKNAPVQGCISQPSRSYIRIGGMVREETAAAI